MSRGVVDFRAIVQQLFHAFKSRANQVVSGTCDGLVLKMHYRWTFLIFLGNFSTVWYKWYNQDEIVCASGFNGEHTGGSSSGGAVDRKFLNYLSTCLSYPYVIDEADMGNRRYLLFYRWISWSLLLVAAVFYIPRKLAKNFEHPKTKHLLETVAQHSPRFDGSEQQISEVALRYIHLNMKTHNGLYYKYLTVNIIALIIDLVVFKFLDFLLEGRFYGYGYNAYPFNRDPIKFTDYISQTFPPFAKCNIDENKMLTNTRNESFGCHLPLMELYEKVFLLVWFWLIILTTVTAIYIVCLLALHLPIVQKFVLRIAKPATADEKISDIVPGVYNNSKIGDVYLLYRIKQHVSHAQFYRMMVFLSKPDLYKKAEALIPQSLPADIIKEKGHTDKDPLSPQYPDLRQRKIDSNVANKNLLNILEADKNQLGQPGHPQLPLDQQRLQQQQLHQQQQQQQMLKKQQLLQHQQRLQHQQQLQGPGGHLMPHHLQHGQGIPPGHMPQPGQGIPPGHMPHPGQGMPLGPNMPQPVQGIPPGHKMPQHIQSMSPGHNIPQQMPGAPKPSQNSPKQQKDSPLPETSIIIE